MNYFLRISRKISLVAWNTLANLSGRVWSSSLSLLAVPIYVRVLGAESYGLIGFFSIFDVVFNLLDFGLSATANRQLARNIAAGEGLGKNKALLRTFEIIYWITGVAITLIMLSMTGWLAQHWINAGTIPPDEVRRALIVVSFAFLARWPLSLYTGVLRGMQAQVLQNVILVITSTCRILGGLLIISLVSATIHAYVLWYAFASFLEIALIAAAAWSLLSRLGHDPARFEWGVITGTWKFALSFNLVGVIGTFVSSADRLIISKLLPLDQLGYYSIAATASGIPPLMSIALMTALFPRLSGQSARQDMRGLHLSYHQSFEMLSFISWGMALAVVFYSRDLLTLWMHMPPIVANAYQPLMLLAVANMVNAISNAPYTLLVAHGQTRSLLIVNCMSAATYIPLLVLGISSRGLLGSAALFLLLNCSLLLCYLYLVDRSIMPNSLRQMLSGEFLPYGVCGFICIGLPRLLTATQPALLVLPLSLLAYIVLGLHIFKPTPLPAGAEPEAA